MEIKPCLPRWAVLNEKDMAKAWPLVGTQLTEADVIVVILGVVLMTLICTFWVFLKPGLSLY